MIMRPGPYIVDHNNEAFLLITVQYGLQYTRHSKPAIDQYAIYFRWIDFIKYLRRILWEIIPFCQVHGKSFITYFPDIHEFYLQMRIFLRGIDYRIFPQFINPLITCLHTY